MINIHLIVLGKLKEKHMKDFSAEYEKRLSGYCKLTVTELEPVKLSDNPSQSEIQNALNKETQLIKPALRQAREIGGAAKRIVRIVVVRRTVRVDNAEIVGVRRIDRAQPRIDCPLRTATRHCFRCAPKKSLSAYLRFLSLLITAFSSSYSREIASPVRCAIASSFSAAFLPATVFPPAV